MIIKKINKHNVGLIDLGISNIGKITNILQNSSVNIKFIKSQKDFKNIDKIIFPGLGIFGKASLKINSEKIRDLLIEFCTIKKKPYLGICLGMQILTSGSDESPNDNGLNIINAKCKRLVFDKGKNITVPHIGFKKNISNNKIIRSKDKFYFVHSYFLNYSKNNDYMKSYVDYGSNKICTFIKKDNIFASQFHPELSGKVGIKFINDFLKL